MYEKMQIKVTIGSVIQIVDRQKCVQFDNNKY